MPAATPSPDDARIRAALRDAQSKGKLGVVAAVTGVPESRLRAILANQDAIPLMEQAMLSIHLRM